MLKSLALATALITVTPAFAGGGYHHGGGGGWVGPFVGGAIVGGLLGGAYAYPYAPYYNAPAPYYTPSPYQPYYHWDCNVYGQCGWVWR